MQPLIGTGLYPLRQAARLVGQEVRNVRRWLKGYSWKYRSGRSYSGPLWHTEYEGADLPGERVLSFRDLLELRMVAEFATRGVDLKVIRATIEVAKEDFGSAYPLSNRRFLTDGKRIFMQAIEETTGDEKMVDVLRRQFVFANVIRESLFAGIVYEDGHALRWYPERNKAVMLDPEIQFGTPTLAGIGIPTDTIYDAWLAEGKDRAAVARLYGITPAMVTKAVGFEQRLDA
jgi:uncharacterized protein (DUF433 family)